MASKTSAGTRKLAITQIRSRSGRPEKHRRTLAALGFKRNQQTVVHDDTPAIRGMIGKIPHLIQVVEVGE
jgi:large subunit ribosomal protein L30